MPDLAQAEAALRDLRLVVAQVYEMHAPVYPKEESRGAAFCAVCRVPSPCLTRRRLARAIELLEGKKDA